MKYLTLTICLVILTSCGGPQPRKPVTVKTGSFFEQSVARNKLLLAKEEKLIQDIITKDSLHTYFSTADGSWYYYEVKNETADYLPKPDDLVVLNYNILRLNNDTIYSNKDIGILKYKVDKQEFFPGFRNSVKILKENEVATFLFPSGMAYGYHGDNKKISTNTPIKSTISIFKIEKGTDSIQN